MIVYSDIITRRLTYTLDLLIQEILGIDYRLTVDANENFTNGEPVINYSGLQINNALKINPHGLLFEEDIKVQDIEPVKDWDGCPVFFETPDGHIPFDLFAASFFLVSRYEEYLPFVPDRHGRFSATSSVAYKLNIHKLPLVNLWVKKLGEKLKAFFPGLILKPLSFNYLPTIDIDNPWKFLNKPVLRRNLGMIRDVFHLDLNNASCRYKVLRGKLTDPFDTYDEWEMLHGDMAGQVIVFVLSSSATCFDMAINPNNSDWQKLIKKLSEKHNIGMHPSYNTNRDEKRLPEEKKFLESLCGISITRSRQHFLRLNMPGTYRKLIKAGIREDYSMGYHDLAGFRAGIAHPFRFFDLEKNKTGDLLIYPFAVMDRALKDYMQLNTFNAFEEICEIINQLRMSGGIFISVWHNESLGDNGEWKGWKSLYIKMNKHIKKLLNDPLL